MRGSKATASSVVKAVPTLFCISATTPQITILPSVVAQLGMPAILVNTLQGLAGGHGDSGIGPGVVITWPGVSNSTGSRSDVVTWGWIAMPKRPFLVP